ncbi:type II secretion system protein [Candidatus Peregrinibacteria bacterium]|nr:type II secretion system protein [Candidatus Peregrinibacteria bacterium]
MRQKAFTIIELLIVIAIIGVLTVAFLPSLIGGGAKIRDARRVDDVRKIMEFLTEEYIYKGVNLPSTAAYSCISPVRTTAPNISKAIRDKLDYFGDTFPTDPNSNKGWLMSGTERCRGQYIYFKGTSCYRPVLKPPEFPFIVMAQMENPDNGNLADYVAGVSLMRCGAPAYNFAASGPVFGVLGSK